METFAPAPSLSAIRRLLDRPVVVVDVGARWGFSSIWDDLGDSCRQIGFEPDPEEYAELVSLHRGNPNIMFVPHALGSESGLRTLYLTKDRGGTSVLHPSDDAVRRHPGLQGGAVESTTVITMTTLDEWAAGAGVGPIDAVKLDTQGSELDILRGGERILADVRVVEVEVEFNELYEGVPLFGAVDGFLRTRGFTLWKLRDLAHYAQHGAPTGWRNEEACHFDTGTVPEPGRPWWHRAAFAGGPGQLFWANAFFVRTDVAYPAEARLGWEQLVRDACLTRAHGFIDLTLIALARARELAPDHAREAIDLALAPERVRFHASLGPGAPVLDGTLKVSLGDPGVVGGGWHPFQRDGRDGFAWSGPGRDAWVDVPVVFPEGTRLEVLSRGAMSEELLDGLVVEVNGCPLDLRRSPHRDGVLLTAGVPAGYRSAKRFTRVMFRLQAAPVALQAPGATGDHAERGVAVSWLRCCPPGVE